MIARVLFAIVIALMVTGGPATAQSPSRTFAETGFTVDDDVIWDFFRKRGGERVFGPAISRQFSLFGLPTQLFRNAALVREPGGVRPINLLDAGYLEPARVGDLDLPAADPGLTAGLPAPGTLGYGAALAAFLRESIPNSFQDQPVGFLDAFNSTVRREDAFPDGVGDDGLLGAFALEVWGLPTARPARVRGADGPIVLRFQRGAMAWEPACACVKALPVGEALRDLLSGDRDGGQFARQYNPATHLGPLRPADLPNSDFANALRRSDEPAPPPPPVQAAAPAPQPSRSVDRDPKTIILTQEEVGVDGKLQFAESGDDPRGIWYRRRWERKRETLAENTGPTVADNTIWIAYDIPGARSIFDEESARLDFPEAGDKREGSFPFPIAKMGDQISAISACERCPDQKLKVHHRIVARKGNVVSVLYLFGRDSTIDQPMATWFAAQVLLRI
jgi:hypothetical protein